MVDSLQAATYSSSSQGISDADGMMKAVKVNLPQCQLLMKSLLWYKATTELRYKKKMQEGLENGLWILDHCSQPQINRVARAFDFAHQIGKVQYHLHVAQSCL